MSLLLENGQQLSSSFIPHEPRRSHLWARRRRINSEHQLLATVAVGFVKTRFILVATSLFERIEWWSLLLTSIAGMIFLLAGLGMGLIVIWLWRTSAIFFFFRRRRLRSEPPQMLVVRRLLLSGLTGVSFQLRGAVE